MHFGGLGSVHEGHALMQDTGGYAARLRSAQCHYVRNSFLKFTQ